MDRAELATAQASVEAASVATSGLPSPTSLADSSSPPPSSLPALPPASVSPHPRPSSSSTSSLSSSSSSPSSSTCSAPSSSSGHLASSSAAPIPVTSPPPFSVGSTSPPGAKRGLSSSLLPSSTPSTASFASSVSMPASSAPSLYPPGSFGVPAAPTVSIYVNPSLPSHAQTPFAPVPCLPQPTRPSSGLAGNRSGGLNENPAGRGEQEGNNPPQSAATANAHRERKTAEPPPAETGREIEISNANGGRASSAHLSNFPSTASSGFPSAGSTAQAAFAAERQREQEANYLNSQRDDEKRINSAVSFLQQPAGAAALTRFFSNFEWTDNGVYLLTYFGIVRCIDIFTGTEKCGAHFLELAPDPSFNLPSLTCFSFGFLTSSLQRNSPFALSFGQSLFSPALPEASRSSGPCRKNQTEEEEEEEEEEDEEEEEEEKEEEEEEEEEEEGEDGEEEEEEGEAEQEEEENDDDEADVFPEKPRRLFWGARGTSGRLADRQKEARGVSRPQDSPSHRPSGSSAHIPSLSAARLGQDGGATGIKRGEKGKRRKGILREADSEDPTRAPHTREAVGRKRIERSNPLACFQETSDPAHVALSGDQRDAALLALFRRQTATLGRLERLLQTVSALLGKRSGPASPVDKELFTFISPPEGSSQSPSSRASSPSRSPEFLPAEEGGGASLLQPPHGRVASSFVFSAPFSPNSSTPWQPAPATKPPLALGREEGRAGVTDEAGARAWWRRMSEEKAPRSEADVKKDSARSEETWKNEKPPAHAESEEGRNDLCTPLERPTRNQEIESAQALGFEDSNENASGWEERTPDARRSHAGATQREDAISASTSSSAGALLHRVAERKVLGEAFERLAYALPTDLPEKQKSLGTLVLMLSNLESAPTEEVRARYSRINTRSPRFEERFKGMLAEVSAFLEAVGFCPQGTILAYPATADIASVVEAKSLALAYLRTLETMAQKPEQACSPSASSSSFSSFSVSPTPLAAAAPPSLPASHAPTAASVPGACFSFSSSCSPFSSSSFSSSSLLSSFSASSPLEASTHASAEECCRGQRARDEEMNKPTQNSKKDTKSGGEENGMQRKGEEKKASEAEPEAEETDTKTDETSGENPRKEGTRLEGETREAADPDEEHTRKDRSHTENRQAREGPTDERREENAQGEADATMESDRNVEMEKEGDCVPRANDSKAET
ncbi:conserved hypothetical protein [Neospora caninum Liverpool]|uniref:PUB domain-containing protein n=1 Tax=Neospora caninum (strain Liverpool) TaxID=572307 RepID=F0VQJ3_NEOCL|nr:conserved hypothetical protein [Neospora caninum Liverpool]CBZ55990.1 conserved hypothetical protein [Neospora caninum Liverpool]|eukprot:XP_003886016.1 conserved hypothetical protein [Neospora caninum Liverpool]